MEVKGDLATVFKGKHDRDIVSFLEHVFNDIELKASHNQGESRVVADIRATILSPYHKKN